MTDPDDTYISFLLRLRKSGEPADWRATLVNPNNGEILTFSTLNQLIRFFHEITGTATPETTGKPLSKER